MSDYLFTTPLVEGKKETWKNYIKEISGSRKKEYMDSRKKAGLKVEQVFLQETPHGDMCVVRWEAENPKAVFEHLAKSNEPFDKWFRDSILVECHNMDLSQLPPLNQIALDHQENPVKEFAGAGKGK